MLSVCLLTVLVILLITKTETTIKADSTQKPSGKILVAYFTSPEFGETDAISGASRLISDGKEYGNTEYMARIIGDATNGDLFAIKTVRTYPDSHEELIAAAKEERDSNSRPELSTHIENLEDYDVVFVGYPNWFFDIPMPLYTFFEEYDFTNKTVIPFYTYGRSGSITNSISNIISMEPEANVISGLFVSRDSISHEREKIVEWIGKQGFKNKESK
jgi:flavodoxin